MKITLSLLSAASLVVCSSCVFLGPGVPVRVSTETKDISGVQRDLDFSFLKAGSTTKDEVLTNLKPIDTGIEEPHLFWGRWESSAWFSAPLLAPYVGSREWGPVNILITFDSNNLVQTWKVLKDKALLQELGRLELAPLVPMDLSSPLVVGVKLRYWESDAAARLILSEHSFEYQGAHHGFTTARSNLHGITLVAEVLPSGDPLDKAHQPQPDPSHLWIKLHFLKGTPKGKSLTFGADPQELLSLRRYVTGSEGKTMLPPMSQ